MHKMCRCVHISIINAVSSYQTYIIKLKIAQSPPCVVQDAEQVGPLGQPTISSSYAQIIFL